MHVSAFPLFTSPPIFKASPMTFPRPSKEVGWWVRQFTWKLLHPQRNGNDSKEARYYSIVRSLCLTAWLRHWARISILQELLHHLLKSDQGQVKGMKKRRNFLRSLLLPLSWECKHNKNSWGQWRKDHQNYLSRNIKSIRLQWTGILKTSMALQRRLGRSGSKGMVGKNHKRDCPPGYEAVNASITNSEPVFPRKTETCQPAWVLRCGSIYLPCPPHFPVCASQPLQWKLTQPFHWLAPFPHVLFSSIKEVFSGKDLINCFLWSLEW